jgi:hypothetical protein
MMAPDDRSRRDSSWDDETLARETERAERLAANARLVRALGKFGTIDSVPWVMISDSAQRALPLDAAARRVLIEIDGRRTVAAVVEASELPNAAALTAIIDLAERGVIALKAPKA